MRVDCVLQRWVLHNSSAVRCVLHSSNAVRYALHSRSAVRWALQSSKCGALHAAQIFPVIVSLVNDAPNPSLIAPLSISVPSVMVR